MRKLVVAGLAAALAGAAWWATGGDTPTRTPAAGLEGPEPAVAQVEPAAAPDPAAGPSDAAQPASRSAAAAQQTAAHPMRMPCDYDLAVARIDDADDPLGVPPRPGQVPQFDPAATCRLSGRVQLRRGQAAVRIATGIDAGRRVETDEQGWFELPDLHPGRIVVRIEGDGGNVAERMIHLAVGESTPGDLLVDFTRTGRATLRLVDHVGAPLADTDLRIDGRVARTGADGRAVVDGLPLGEAWCEVVHGDHARLCQAVPVRPRDEEAEDAVLALQPGSQVEVLLDADCDPRDLLQIVVVPSIGYSGPGPELLAVPWWTWQPLAIPAGEKAYVRQLPAGRYRIVPYCNGAPQRGKVALVELPAGRMRNVRIDLGRPETEMVHVSGCDASPTIAWRTANRFQKSADDYGIDTSSAGRLGILASPGTGGLLQGDARGRVHVPAALAQHGATWCWSSCGAGFASAPQLLVPSMPGFREAVEALPGSFELELPAECAGRELRLRFEGAARKPFVVGADARIDLGELHGLWRLTLTGRDLAKPATIVVAANGRTSATFREPPAAR